MTPVQHFKLRPPSSARLARLPALGSEETSRRKSSGFCLSARLVGAEGVAEQLAPSVVRSRHQPPSTGAEVVCEPPQLPCGSRLVSRRSSSLPDGCANVPESTLESFVRRSLLRHLPRLRAPSVSVIHP